MARYQGRSSAERKELNNWVSCRSVVSIGEDWDRNHTSEQAFSQAHEQLATKAVPDSSAKVVGPTSESVPEVQIQESNISSVPNPAPNPVLKRVPEQSPGLPAVKNAYARIIKLPKLLDCCGHPLLNTELS